MTTPKTWPENSYPTGVQLADWLERCTREERVAWAEVAVHDRQTVDRIQETMLRAYPPRVILGFDGSDDDVSAVFANANQPDRMWVIPEGATFGPIQPPEDLSAYQVPAPGKGRGATPDHEIVDEAWLFKGDERVRRGPFRPDATRPVDQYTVCDLTADCRATDHDSRCLTTFGKVTLRDQLVQQPEVVTTECTPDNPCQFCLNAPGGA